MTRRLDAEEASTVAARATREDLAQVAHDLRTPLSAVLMWVRLLRAGAVPDPGAALAAIEKSAMELSSSIDRLAQDGDGGRAKAPDTRAGDSGRAKAPAARDLQRDAKRGAVRTPRAPAAPRQARPRGGPARG